MVISLFYNLIFIELIQFFDITEITCMYNLYADHYKIPFYFDWLFIG